MKQVHRYLRKLQVRTPLQEQDVIIRWNSQDTTHSGVSTMGKIHERLRAMADFHHRYPCAGEIKQFIAYLQ
ncbi:hypothetical protein ALFP_2729 [Alcaligenes faecalis]|jgi:hypothetical protein|nr:hypothetical protein ALFP_2729 [Alcaligenes faecalis]